MVLAVPANCGRSPATLTGLPSHERVPLKKLVAGFWLSRPLGDRILVKRVESDTKTKGGIIIPDTAKEKPQEALVVSVGPGAVRTDGSRRELLVKAGDSSLFRKYAVSEVSLDGQDHLILNESDVLSVIG